MSKKEPRFGWADYHYDHEARHYQTDNCPLCKEETKGDTKPARS